MSEMHNKIKNKDRSDNLFPVVGVGASAGGLDAFKRLIRAIPENAGVAYILVQHLEPSHDSMLVEILQKITSIPVQEITNNVVVEPNRVYVIPSNKLLTANDGRLELSPRGPKGERNMPIDLFFTSLSEVHQSQAIGVVLSGTGTDGTQGLMAIKEHGGFTFAQETQSIAFPAMPQSAIDADVVDFVLTPEEIPLQLARISEIFRKGLEAEKDGKTASEDAFRQIIALLRVRKGNDFTYYKQTTIRRRIVRRMGLNKIENITDYLTYFMESVAEQDLLYQDLLIPVTGFFRDPKAFSVLYESVFPNILNDKDDANPLRIWVAGCSTGEEPYSIAINLSEYLGDKVVDYKIQIFATDISERSISKARTGVYSKKEMGGLSAQQVEKYFTKVNGGYHVNKSIRDMCVFACHNFLKDPPFAKMSLISCRNVLIYMETFLQKRALTTFHYALNEHGFLFLGNSETTAPAAELFAAYGKSEKIYTRKSVPGKFLHLASARTENIPKGNGNTLKKEPGRDDFQRGADEIILAKFSPSGVVVNEEMDIVQFRGGVGAWLEPSPGKASLNVLKMVKPGLAFELRNALHKVKMDNKPVVKKGISLVSPDKQQFVTIEVIPLLNTIERYYLVLFEDTMTNLAGEDLEGSTRDALNRELAESERNNQLERELAQLREDIRSITEDQEAVNEELQSANEELLSGSEELQSLNEELETSKEEIQSTNEELTTLNQELIDRNDQLNISRLYAESIIATIREPLIVLDKDLKVRTANQSYYKKFKTSEDETEGKSFYQLRNGQWNIPALRSALENSLLTDGRITDVEVKQKIDEIGERTLLLNACRISRKDNAELLILLAFEDITDTRNREHVLINFSRELEIKVAERTLSLKEANTLLKQSNESLEQYATIASHDLQEPLRKIQTFSALLNERFGKNIAGEAKELIDKISVAALRMSGLIRDVLNFSKVLDSNVFERVDLNVILQNVRNDFDMLIEQKKAVIMQDKLPVIKAVPLQMNQLFYNLLGNAIKFSRPDVSPVIHITYRTLMAGEVQTYPSLNSASTYCEIVFSDNGIGIEEEFMEQVFLIFQRLNARDRFEGTGIGLALCKKIVLNHKGEIYVSSKEGIGTEFHVLLPIE
ncbi:MULTISPECIES: CheR family methyltransferase [Niastella]|uniref:histidine kinase n=1 Tax=Niastella soli TaxID=2821487 RepID=A0ABS3YVI4_9BACT|nr:CheR family methyltransferase [Niastella soli]MBO9201873.1 PAS domain-containing protein [Niastella soli]